MYDFYYIKRKYLDSTLLFTNTDSLTYQIQMDNVYEDFYTDKQLFDFPGNRKESPLYNDENKNLIGKIKDGLNGKLEMKKAKGERRNEEGKGSEEERGQKGHYSSGLCNLFIPRKNIYVYHADYRVI